MNQQNERVLDDGHSTTTPLESPLEGQGDLSWQRDIINETLSRDALRFMYPHPRDAEPNREGSEVSPVELIFPSIPPRENRPISGRNDQTAENETLFRSKESASQMLDVEFLCTEAFKLLGDEFPSSILTCCQGGCFASLATGGNPRFYALVRRVYHEATAARTAITRSCAFIQRPTQSEQRQTG